MVIPKRILNNWKKLKSYGDLTSIAKLAKEKGGTLASCNASTVNDAFNTGACSDELFEVIAQFYNSRKQRIQTAA